MIKLYDMTVLALVCASSISVDAKGAANHQYYAHDTRMIPEGSTPAPEMA
jgi:hypothetical protein